MIANTGNFIINKYLIDHINIQNESENIKNSITCDAIHFITLLFEQFDLDIIVVKDLHYFHTVHNGSIYRQLSHLYTDFNDQMHHRFYKLSNLP